MLSTQASIYSPSKYYYSGNTNPYFLNLQGKRKLVQEIGSLKYRG